MTKTTVRGEQITDDTVYREDLNTDTAGRAVVRKILAGFGVTISSTGVDSGTGDVTVTSSAAEDFSQIFLLMGA